MLQYLRPYLRQHLLPSVVLGSLGLLSIFPNMAHSTDIVADSLTRHGNGTITADGHVIIQREGETLSADRIIYDEKNHQMTATGHVQIDSDNNTIHAERGDINTQTNNGTFHQVDATLASDAHITADTLQRLGEGVFHAENITFTYCPTDAEAWQITASQAKLDQNKGVMTARHVRYEIAGIPVFYSPYWSHPLKRTSGFLTPYFGTSSSRGTEWALPYYFAPAGNWDATLTPRWMTKRGFKSDLEVRRATQYGYDDILVEGLHDTSTATNRSRVSGHAQHALPYDMSFTADINYLSDYLYLRDLAAESSIASASYAKSEGKISGAWQYGHMSLITRHQQNLTTPSNAATLQILPQLNTRLHTAKDSPHLQVYFDQQTTRFVRGVGVDGMRLDLHPYIESPWSFANGSIQSTLRVGSRYTRYWLQDTINTRNPSRQTYEVSLENRILLERISDHHLWRHAITPILRYDYISAPDQSLLPNFDSSFGGLSINNLLGGNRYSGIDRIERMHRISLMIEHKFQHKSESTSAARDVLQFRMGSAYDLQRTSIDPALTPNPDRPFSNLLTDAAVFPTPNTSISAGGQYDPSVNKWLTSQVKLHAHSDQGSSLEILWSQTDPSYSTEAELIQTTAQLQLAQRWQAFGGWKYDALLKVTQSANIGVQYTHPCWDLSLEGYRSRIASNVVKSDTGIRFLLGFKGLGSVGGS